MYVRLVRGERKGERGRDRERHRDKERQKRGGGDRERLGRGGIASETKQQRGEDREKGRGGQIKWRDRLELDSVDSVTRICH